MDPSDAPTSWGPPQSRTVTWWDPAATSGAAVGRSGLEMIQGLQSGEIPPPPLTQTLGGLIFSRVETGRVEIQGTPDSSVYNPIGVVHGGYAATMLDSALGCAVHTTLAAGWAYTSIEIKINFLRAITADSGVVTARGWVTKPGRRVAFADGDIVDEAGTVLATASSSILVMAPS